MDGKIITELLRIPVDCVLPVDVRSGSAPNLETPAVMISTLSLSPLANKQNLMLVSNSNPGNHQV